MVFIYRDILQFLWIFAKIYIYTDILIKKKNNNIFFISLYFFHLYRIYTILPYFLNLRTWGRGGVKTKLVKLKPCFNPNIVYQWTWTTWTYRRPASVSSPRTLATSTTSQTSSSKVRMTKKIIFMMRIRYRWIRWSKIRGVYVLSKLLIFLSPPHFFSKWYFFP